MGCQRPTMPKNAAPFANVRRPRSVTVEFDAPPRTKTQRRREQRRRAQLRLLDVAQVPSEDLRWALEALSVADPWVDMTPELTDDVRWALGLPYLNAS